MRDVVGGVGVAFGGAGVAGEGLGVVQGDVVEFDWFGGFGGREGCWVRFGWR